MKKNRLFPFVLGISCILASPAHAWEGQTLKVCSDPNNPPYSDNKGQGFENKLAELIGKEFGKKVEYTWFPQRMGFIRNTLKAKLPDSEEYKCDLIMGLPTGIEMAATTEPYYRSTYVLVIAKKRGWDDIAGSDDLAKLDEGRRGKLKIAMFDGSPATTWLLNHNLVEHAIPYQSMTGDASVNTTQLLEKDFADGKLDMAIVWGPIAAYLEKHAKGGQFTLIPMKQEPGVRFTFPISMGVRIPDKDRKAELNTFISKHGAEIDKILQDYRIPLASGE
jgi:mxaJ protein